MSEGKNDVPNYRAMSAPFSSADEANAALRAFFDDVRELRQKHRLADVLTVVSVNIAYPGGDGRVITWTHNGDSQLTEQMAAFTLGQAQAERREMVAKLLAGKAKVAG